VYKNKGQLFHELLLNTAKKLLIYQDLCEAEAYVLRFKGVVHFDRYGYPRIWTLDEKLLLGLYIPLNQACKGMHPRPDFLSPSPFFPYLLLKPTQKEMKNQRKTHPFHKPAVNIPSN
jgi:hypothetical protein